MLQTINKTFAEFQNQYQEVETLENIQKDEGELFKPLDDHLVGLFTDEIALFPYDKKTGEILIQKGFVPDEENAQWIRDIVIEQQERVELSVFVSSLFKRKTSFQLDILDVSFVEFHAFAKQNLNDNFEFPEYHLYDNDFDLPSGDYYEDFEDFEETYLRLNDGFARLTLSTNEKYYQAYDAITLLNQDDIPNLKSKIIKLQNYKMTTNKVRNVKCLEFIVSELEK